ncbi:MAG: hypothetical protein CFE31_07260 [Rhizobiales bacterium PAR1]|nr:MAG: hypothetical protein CFE31_07260 [Rhizobiales bacterium PAR1]
MKTTVLKVIGFSAFLFTLNYPVQAYDAQCDKIANGQRRALCQCRSDAGATVSVRADDSGKLKVRESRVRSKNLPQVQACMDQKGFKGPV